MVLSSIGICFYKSYLFAQIRWVKDAKAAAYLNVMPVKKVTRDYTGKSSHALVLPGSLTSCAQPMQGSIIITLG